MTLIECIEKESGMNCPEWLRETIERYFAERTAETEQNVPNDDLISRKMAIEALHTWFADGFEEDRWWNSTHVLAAIEGVPSAQTEVRTQMSVADCVSRQAVLSYIDRIVHQGTGKQKSFEFMQKHIENMPSAQPDLSDYSDRLWKAAYERGKREAQPEPKWIPCSERLPDDLTETNVTWTNHTPESYYDFIKDKPFTASAVYYKGKWYWYSSTCVDLLAEYGRNPNQEVDDGIEITAWMPLPEPWKGEQE